MTKILTQDEIRALPSYEAKAKARRDYDNNISNHAPELLALLEKLNHAFYVDGTSKALKPLMAQTKDLLKRTRGEQ